MSEVVDIRRMQPRRHNTRARLVRAAQTVIADCGLQNATVLEITERANVAFGSFYNHFRDKEAVVRAVVEELRRELTEGWNALPARFPDPAERLTVALYGAFARIGDDPKWAWALYRSAPALLGEGEPLFGWLHQCITEGVAQGRFRALDPDLATAAFIGGMLAVLVAGLKREMEPMPPEYLTAQCLLPLGVDPAQTLAFCRRLRERRAAAERAL